MIAIRLLNILAAVFFFTLVAGCGSGDSGTPDAQNLKGTIAIPESRASTVRRAFTTDETKLMVKENATCSNVPGGYKPLQGADIIFQDGPGQQIGSGGKTDDCGSFNVNAPSDTVSVNVVAAGFRNINTDVALFQDSSPTGGIVSTIPDTSTYEIGSLARLDNDVISLTIVDSATGTAVIGIPSNAFSATLNGVSTELSLKSIENEAASEMASVGMVLDASGSMSASITDPNTNDRFTRYQLAAIAGHLFLDQKSRNDEVSALIFSSSFNFINDASVANLFQLNDASGQPASYTFSADGFTTESNELRFVIDAYNRSSQLYAETNLDTRHPDTPNLSIVSFYPWGGSTALVQSNYLVTC